MAIVNLESPLCCIVNLHASQPNRAIGVTTGIFRLLHDKTQEGIPRIMSNSA
jgi:hypothetical protein